MNQSVNLGVRAWDSCQRAVIESDASSRMIVEAGPGTGKTAVSCARLAHLIEGYGVQPSKTWMISFTRTAVAEIRSRLAEYLGEAAFAVKVATVDSHAWSIHSGYDSTATLTGTYENNIDSVIALIRADPEAREYLENVEHLIVDEAQDLVGRRADLVEEIIRALHPSCGVTMFADEAQAIYEFSEDGENSGSELPLLDRIRDDGDLGFVQVMLDTVHRTSSPGLLTIFSEVRKAVMSGCEGSSGVYSTVRDGIMKHADASDLKHGELGIADLPIGSLVLFRTRSEALEASQYCAAPHSLRLSGYPASMPPWIGICFHDFILGHMGRHEFTTRWLERVENACPPDYGVAEAWARLIRAGGAADGSLDMKRLRTRLGRYAPPVELTLQEYGLPGPIIGTIHASKGREANDVFLVMPDREEFKDLEDEEEETRVLFVGSTRARATLRVGKGRKWIGSSIDKGRSYRTLAIKKNPSAMVEVGRSEDIDALGMVGKSAMTMEECKAAQEWLGIHSSTLMGLTVAKDGDHDWNYRIVEAAGSLKLGWLTPRFRDDVWMIANTLSEKGAGKLRPPKSIKYVRSFGSRTLVIAPSDPLLEKVHAPWAQSGFLLAPKVAAFTKAWFWSVR